MKTKIFGKKLAKRYEVVSNQKSIENENGDQKTVFTAKPYIKEQLEVEGWETIVPDIDGSIKYNRDLASDLHRLINISEDETVRIEDEIYRADLNEMHIFTDKVISTDEGNKEYYENELACLIGDYNEQMIGSNDEMTAYCKLHKLDPREADCEEVFKLVFPNKHFAVKNGAVNTNPQAVTLTVSDYPSIAYSVLGGSHEVTTDLSTTNQIIGLGSATSATTSTR